MRQWSMHVHRDFLDSIIPSGITWCKTLLKGGFEKS